MQQKNPSSDAAGGAAPVEALSTDFDVKQLGIFAAIASLSYVFWVVGAMEMIERLAYYGVKAVATLYAKTPVADGGLGVDLNAFGTILTTWALTQTLVPVFSGGLSDRYGYKETIFVSTVVKILGYLIMAFFTTYWGFFAGAIVLATGTAIFKPGIQGTLVKSTSRLNSSVAWGIFYQTVNIGGFIGPLLAGFLRKMSWSNVFFACALIISLNFLLLCVYREVGKEERIANAKAAAAAGKRKSLFEESLVELMKPHVFLYLAIFSGFWFMFNALFDVLPAHIDDWVNTSDIVHTLFPGGQSHNKFVNFFIIMNAEGTQIQPEGLLNLNAGLIMTTCFIVAGLSGKLRATTSMVIGTLLSSAALFLSGYSVLGWVSVAAIGLFSIGEMLSSPKFSEFMGNFAPHDKKAMYLGFSQISLAIGWTLEGKIGPALYDEYASKDRFSRHALVAELGAGRATADEAIFGELTESSTLKETPVSLVELAQRDAKAFVEKIPQGEAFKWLVKMTGKPEWDVTAALYDANRNSIGYMWYLMCGIGVASAIGIAIYGSWIRTLKLN